MRKTLVSAVVAGSLAIAPAAWAAAGGAFVAHGRSFRFVRRTRPQIKPRSDSSAFRKA